MSRTLARLTGAFGVAHVAVLLTGFAITAPALVTLASPPSDITSFYTGADSASVFAGGYIEAIGLLLFLPFAAGLYRWLRDPEPRQSFAAGTARMAALGYTLLSLAPGMSAGAAALWIGQQGTTEPELLVALNALRTFSYFLALLSLAMFLVAVAVSAYGSRSLPRPLAVFGGVAGVLLGASVAGAVGGWADLASIIALPWLVVTSVWLLMGAGRPQRLSRRAREMVA